mmetsp:Transcript_8289/g.29342  ORF Transcript_8289/g.29342 Transcript_8289/m.29342 type:complete len:295 (-) Transcript_8289:1383-2267(-)
MGCFPMRLFRWDFSIGTFSIWIFPLGFFPNGLPPGNGALRLKLLARKTRKTAPTALSRLALGFCPHPPNGRPKQRVAHAFQRNPPQSARDSGRRCRVHTCSEHSSRGARPCSATKSASSAATRSAAGASPRASPSKCSAGAYQAASATLAPLAILTPRLDWAAVRVSLISTFSLHCRAAMCTSELKWHPARVAARRCSSAATILEYGVAMSSTNLPDGLVGLNSATSNASESRSALPRSMRRKREGRWHRLMAVTSASPPRFPTALPARQSVCSVALLCSALPMTMAAFGDTPL